MQGQQILALCWWWFFIQHFCPVLFVNSLKIITRTVEQCQQIKCCKIDSNVRASYFHQMNPKPEAKQNLLLRLIAKASRIVREQLSFTTRDQILEVSQSSGNRRSTVTYCSFFPKVIPGWNGTSPFPIFQRAFSLPPRAFLSTILLVKPRDPSIRLAFRNPGRCF